MISEKRHIDIDILKCIAIIGVIFDHSLGWLYTNESLWRLSWGMVALFILGGDTMLMGHVNAIENGIIL